MIQNLIAELEVVNRQLSVPLRTRPVPWPEETGIPEARASEHNWTTPA
jgi:hypothetical protein